MTRIGPIKRKLICKVSLKNGIDRLREEEMVRIKLLVVYKTMTCLDEVGVKAVPNGDLSKTGGHSYAMYTLGKKDCSVT